MAFTLPQFNLTYEYWDLDTDVSGDPPGLSGACALMAPSRTFLFPIPAPIVGAIPEIGSLYLPMHFVAVPTGTQFDVPRTDEQNVGGTILIASGIDRYYQVIALMVVAAGWPNEYFRYAVVECTQAWLDQTGNPWNVPIPP